MSEALALIALTLVACARERQSRSPGNGLDPTGEVALPSSGAGCSDEDLRRGSRQVLHGLATYYHDSLAGNPTASGEPYDPDRLSAAHRTLPFGTRLRVTRTDSATSSVVCVTVNDRGPFAGRKRVLDVSRRAAEHLRMTAAGVVEVRIDVL
jgi:rare lipoprotein A